MTSFEYITIPVSIVLALGLGKILTATMVVIETGRRDWLHLLWCAVLMLVMLGQWVAVWGLRSNAVWSAGEFFVVMLSPILFYMAAHLLVSSRPEAIESWSAHLSQIARPLLLLMLLSVGAFFLRNLLVPDVVNLSTVFRPTLVAVFLVNVIALLSPRTWLLAASSVIWLAPVIGMLLIADLR